MTKSEIGLNVKPGIKSFAASAKVEKSLRYSIYDGAASGATTGLTQDYIAPFALALKATSTQIGLLTSIANMAAALFQLKAPAILRRAGTRKRMILPVVLVEALLWAPLALIPFLFSGHSMWGLTTIFTLIIVFGSLSDPAWGSMMADLVPVRKRGRYFGNRGKICGFTTLAFAFVAAFILWLFGHQLFIGFATIFALALSFRLVSWCFLAKMYEPPIAIADKGRFHLLDFINETRATNLGRFVLYVSAMNFATYLAAPFFAVYMLRDLGFGYLTYVVVIASAALANSLALTFWGKRADRAGNLKIIAISSIFIPLAPLLWLAGHNIFYLLLIQLLSGFIWAGFNLCSTNFVYDASRPERRPRCISYFNAMNGSAICLGALLGGILAPHLPPILGYNLLTLFLISGLLRAVIAMTLFHHIVEVRRVSKISTIELIWDKLRLKAMKVWAVPRLVSSPALTPDIGRPYLQQGHIPQSPTVLWPGPSPP
jgi:MFS family permease